MNAVRPLKALVGAMLAACALALCATLPTQAWAAANVGSLAELESALENSSENEIVLTADIDDANEIIWVKRSVTINLNEKTISGSSADARLIRIVNEGSETIEVTIKNGTIVNNVNGGRCVETRSGNITLNLTNVKLNTPGSGGTQPFTVGGSGEGITVNISGSTITAGDGGYAITTFNPVDMTISDSTVTGYCALNIKDADGSVGSKGSTIDVIDSTLTGVNNVAAGDSNSFAVVMIEDSGVTVNVDGGSKIVVDPGAEGNSQFAFALGNELVDAKISSVDVNVAADAEIVCEGENSAVLGISEKQTAQGGIAGNAISVPSEYASDLAEAIASEEDEEKYAVVVSNGLAEVSDDLSASIRFKYCIAGDDGASNIYTDDRSALQAVEGQDVLCAVKFKYYNAAEELQTEIIWVSYGDVIPEDAFPTAHDERSAYKFVAWVPEGIESIDDPVVDAVIATATYEALGAQGSGAGAESGDQDNAGATDEADKQEQPRTPIAQTGDATPFVDAIVALICAAAVVFGVRRFAL